MKIVNHPKPPDDDGGFDLSKYRVSSRELPRREFKPFPLGSIYITPGAMATVTNLEVNSALRRHACGDWGDLDEHDRLANDESLQTGCRLLSAYRTGKGTKFWVITEATRETTTILLPEEY